MAILVIYPRTFMYTRQALKWEIRMLDEAEKWASYSKDPSTKVGAVLYDPRRFTIITTGYNGFPRGVRDDKDLYADRPTKYARVVHAEANAIIDAAYQGKSTRDAMMASTHPPCCDCAGFLIQSGLAGILYEATKDNTELMERHNGSEAMRMFKECNFKIIGVTR
jgi:dCMP deaminase